MSIAPPPNSAPDTTHASRIRRSCQARGEPLFSDDFTHSLPALCSGTPCVPSPRRRRAAPSLAHIPVSGFRATDIPSAYKGKTTIGREDSWRLSGSGIRHVRITTCAPEGYDSHDAARQLPVFPAFFVRIRPLTGAPYLRREPLRSTPECPPACRSRLNLRHSVRRRSRWVLPDRPP